VDLLAGVGVEGFLEPVARDADVVVYRVVKSEPACGGDAGFEPFELR
jgi:hypothetical protein